MDPLPGAALRAARVAAGRSQTELARETGVSKFSLCRVERGWQPLDEAWLPLLPSAIRRPVVEALVARREAETDAVRRTVMRRHGVREGEAGA